MGFWKSIRKIISPITDRKLIKKAAPYLAAAAAMPFGGPAGAMAAASAVGASQRGHGNHWKGAGQGLIKGATYVAAAPTVAQFFGANPQGMIGQMTGLNSPSLLSQLGMSSAPSMGGGMGLWGNGQPGLMQGDNMFSGAGNMLSKFAPNILGGIGSALSQRMLQQPQQQEQTQGAGLAAHAPYQEERGQYQPISGADSPLAMMAPGAAGMQTASPNFNERESLYDIQKRKMAGKTSEKEKERRLKLQQEQEKIKTLAGLAPAAFAHGGYAHGEEEGHPTLGHIKRSNTGGQADDIETTLPEGSYVMNATDVSLMGDGSTDNGIQKLTEFERSLLGGSGIVRDLHMKSKGVRARVSNDEYVLNPASVSAIGKGNLKKGVKVIDGMRKNLRKHKGVQKILPPKAKGLASYMTGGY